MVPVRLPSTDEGNGSYRRLVGDGPFISATQRELDNGRSPSFGEPLGLLFVNSRGFHSGTCSEFRILISEAVIESDICTRRKSPRRLHGDRGVGLDSA